MDWAEAMAKGPATVCDRRTTAYLRSVRCRFARLAGSGKLVRAGDQKRNILRRLTLASSREQFALLKRILKNYLHPLDTGVGKAGISGGFLRKARSEAFTTDGTLPG